MKIPFFPTRRPTLEEVADTRARRMAGIRRMIAVGSVIFTGIVAFLMSMLVLPSMQELRSLQREKERYVHQLERARLEEKRAHDAFLWSSDFEYFEQIARDRANMAKDGETVIRFPVPPTPPVRKPDTNN